MATSADDDDLPGFFLIKLNHKDEIHYVFAEIAASFNPKILGGSKMTDALDELWANRKTADDRGTKPTVVTLPQPGGTTDEWSYFSTKKQSGKKTQSG